MMQLIQTENMAIFGNQSMKKFPAGGLELDQSKRLKGNISSYFEQADHHKHTFH